MFSDGTMIICLGINLLLCGLIMYYCKQKFNSYDHKLQTMMELISALTELTEEEMSKEPTNPIQNLNANETIPVGGACGYNLFHANETTANETTANETTANETTADTDTFTNIVDIETVPNMIDTRNYNYLRSNESHNPYKDLHNLVNITENFNQSDDSLSDDSDIDSDIESESDIDIDNDNDIELNTVELTIDNDDITALPETIKLSSQDGEEPINYDKLTVLELRTIVKDKNLSTHSTRLKRVELLDLLK